MKNLTSIAEHSDYLSASTYSDSEKWQLHRLRVKFGKQTLEKWMFIACDEYGNVLEFPNILDHKYSGTDVNNFKEDLQEYNQAKERCLFEGFEFKGETEFTWIFKHNNTFPIMIAKRDIEYLNVYFKKEIKLTTTAQKQIEF